MVYDLFRDRSTGELPEHGLLRRAQHNQIVTGALGEDRLDRVPGLNGSGGESLLVQTFLGSLLIHEAFDIEMPARGIAELSSAKDIAAKIARSPLRASVRTTPPGPALPIEIPMPRNTPAPIIMPRPIMVMWNRDNSRESSP